MKINKATEVRPEFVMITGFWELLGTKILEIELEMESKGLDIRGCKEYLHGIYAINQLELKTNPDNKEAKIMFSALENIMDWHR